jgi:hypothetical protein
MADASTHAALFVPGLDLRHLPLTEISARFYRLAVLPCADEMQSLLWPQPPYVPVLVVG